MDRSRTTAMKRRGSRDGSWPQKPQGIVAPFDEECRAGPSLCIPAAVSTLTATTEKVRSLAGARKPVTRITGEHRDRLASPNRTGLSDHRTRTLECATSGKDSNSSTFLEARSRSSMRRKANKNVKRLKNSQNCRKLTKRESSFRALSPADPASNSAPSRKNQRRCKNDLRTEKTLAQPNSDPTRHDHETLDCAPP